MKLFKQTIILIGILLLICQVPFSCAQRGAPSGGPLDTIAPSVVSTSPANYTTRFKNKIIRINFDEYINLKDPDKQILISPPLKNKPLIKPMGQPLKYVEIEFLDSLASNTTYTINFGKSIEDNTEGNQLPFYKYVFSTGEEIDSLSVSGTVTDAYKRETDEYISVMLYKLDSLYKDSVVYQQQPTYIAYTQDTTHTFQFENLAEGQYKIAAILDKNQDYLFSPGSEKIGFLTDTITLPTDRQYHFRIFREIRKFKTRRPSQQALQHLYFPVEGDKENVTVSLLSNRPDGFDEAYYFQQKKDTIEYWFKPFFERDSLVFAVSQGSKIDTLVTQLKELEKDSLSISREPGNILALTGRLSFSANTPISKIDDNFLHIQNKDSVEVPFEIDFDKTYNKFWVDFDKKESDSYQVSLFPGAIEDFYGEVNDTIQFSLRTKAESEYANLQITLENINRFPVILQLVNRKGETKRELIHHKEDGKRFEFEFVDPGEYYVRIIYDDNDNGKWDTGNYLKEVQPEEVIYMPKPLDVRQNWEINQTYMLSN